MSTNKRRLMFVMSSIVILLVVMLLATSRKPLKTTFVPTETMKLETNPPINVPKMITYEEAHSWSMVNSMLNTDTNTPQVIYLSNDKLLYVLNSQLYRLNFGQQPVSLYKWESPTLAKVWPLGDGFLIGSKQGESAIWQYARALKQTAENFQYTKFRDLPFGPEQVLEIKYNAEPELAFISFQQQSDLVEYVITPHNLLMEPVQLELNTNPGKYEEHPYYRHKSVKLQDIVTIQPTSKWEENIYTFEDGRGTLIYSQNNGKPTYRYGDLKVIDIKSFQQEGSSAQQFVHVKDEQNKEYISSNGQGFFPFVETMWHEDWILFRPNAFYHQDSKTLKTARFESCWSCDSFFTGISNEYSLEALQFIEKSASGLVFEQKGKKLYLSLYDAVWQGSKTDKPIRSIDSLLMEELKPLETTIGEKVFPQNQREPKTIVELPEMILAKHNTNQLIPAEVEKVIQEKFFSGSGDGNLSALYRKIGEDWYVLIDNSLYVFRDKDITLIGTIPVKMTIWITNYSRNLGAEDFTKLKDFWYVADTVGNRILKLDQKLSIVKELALPAPSATQILDNGQLKVTSLKGITILNSQLEVIKSSRVKAVKIPDNQIVSREISNYDIQPSSYYVDQASKLTWYVQGDALKLYRAGTKEQRSLFVGSMYNGHGAPQFIPDHEKMILLFDNRALVFQRDGTWLKTMDFPRGEQPAIYDRTTEGENSSYYDEKLDVIYLVQGYRIIAINFLKDEVTTLFKQNNSNLRKMVYDQGKLYFTLQSDFDQKFNNNQNQQAETLTEVCILDIISGRMKRYQLKGNWTADKIEKSELVLWSYDNPQDSIQGKYMRYPLQALTVK